jgi:hypothetical protein
LQLDAVLVLLKKRAEVAEDTVLEGKCEFIGKKN